MNLKIVIGILILKTNSNIEFQKDLEKINLPIITSRNIIRVQSLVNAILKLLKTVIALLGPLVAEIPLFL